MISIKWEELETLRKLLGEAERLANTNLTGEIQLDE